MTISWMDGFDHYGSGAVGLSNMLSGLWASVPNSTFATIGAPSWLARTGPYAIANSTDNNGFRRVLPGAVSALMATFGFATTRLPNLNNLSYPIQFRSGANALLFQLAVQSTGVIEFQAADGTVLAATQAPVVVAETWHLFEMKIDIGAGTFELHVDDASGSGVAVIDASGLSLGATNIAQIAVLIGSGGGFNRDDGSPWMDDLYIRTTTGSHNNDFSGDVRVAALYPNADAAAQGWTAQARRKYGNGILDLFTSVDACISCPNAASTDLGAGDWTIEGWHRFGALPTGSNRSQLFGKWDETNNRRSFQLYLGGPLLENGNLVFRTSTDGTAGTVTESISYPWTPATDTWYHIAVVRASNELLLFVNGQQLGLPIADATTYYAGVEPLGIGGQVEFTASVITGTTLDGWMDELRMTVGFARYTSNFTPTGPFPRGSGSDPEWADVVLLCGFDSGLNDESSYARTVTSRNGAAAITPDDGLANYQSIYQHLPQDDTFIEASLVAASSILTLGGQPTANDTVTVGHYTNSGSHLAVYKFVAAVSTAFDVKIGATVAATLFNLLSAINHIAGSGTLYGTGTFVNDDVTAFGLPGAQMSVVANIAGTGGNSIPSTDTLTLTGGWTGTTLAGGSNIPGYSEFYFDRPPPNTTIIFGVEVVTRGFKTDAGTGSEQSSLIGPLGGNTDGANNAMTVNPTYRFDIFETDPDTGSSITPSTIVGGRVRVNRTA